LGCAGLYLVGRLPDAESGGVQFSTGPGSLYPPRLNGLCAALSKDDYMRVRLLSVAAASLLGLLLAPPAIHARARIVPDHVYQQAVSSGSARVIVRLNAHFSPDADMLSEAHGVVQRKDIAYARSAVKSHLKGSRHAVVREYDALPFLAVEAGSDALAMLEALPGLVAQVSEDRIEHIQMAQSGPVVQATQAWAAGFDGTGTIVAVLDTGVMKTHSFLSGKVVAEACFSTNTTLSGGYIVTSFCPGRVSTSTAAGSGVNCAASVVGCDHGTHVAGTVAGGTTGIAGAGVAPGAKIMAIQVFSKFPARYPSCGGTPCALSFTSDQIAALNHVYNQRNAFAGKTIAAINMSLGAGDFFTPCSGDPRVTPIAQLKAAGIATVIAAGNSGYTDSMSAPACVPGAISVGATGDGSLGTVLDQVSSFSNSASFLSLLAPGQWISSSVPPSGFANFAGTSMATPHVAGALAVLRATTPSASVDTLLAALQDSGVAVTDPRPACPGCAASGVTKKRIRINAALDLLRVPDVMASAVSTVAACDPGTVIGVDNTVANGAVAVGSFRVAFYLSADNVLDADDVLLGSRAITSLPAGGTSRTLKNLTVPAGTGPGVYRILLLVDSGSALAESNERNNVRATAAITIGRDVSVTSTADLAVTGATTVAAAVPGQTIAVTNTVKNGPVAVGAFTIAFYLSTDAVFNTGDVSLGYAQHHVIGGGGLQHHHQERHGSGLDGAGNLSDPGAGGFYERHRRRERVQ
jgi:subtilisin